MVWALSEDRDQHNRAHEYSEDDAEENDIACCESGHAWGFVGGDAGPD